MDANPYQILPLDGGGGNGGDDDGDDDDDATYAFP